MSVGSVQSNHGIFTITDAAGNSQQVDIGTLMMMLNLERTDNLDKQLSIQLTEIQERNALIGELTEFMSQCRTMKAQGKDDGYPDGSKTGSDGDITINGVTKPIQGPNGWAEHFGVKWADLGGTRDSHGSSDGKTKWDTTYDGNIANIKSKIDTLNNDSQMANIKLQNLLEKRNNAFEMASKVMDTNNQTVQSTIRNL